MRARAGVAILIAGAVLLWGSSVQGIRGVTNYPGTMYGFVASGATNDGCYAYFTGYSHSNVCSNLLAGNYTLISAPGSFSSWYVATGGSTLQPMDGSLVLTLYLNGAATSLVVTVPAGQTIADAIFSDTTHSVPVVAGDRISINVQNNSVGLSTGIFDMSMKFTAAQ